jgi:murein DD-endopeptidase MepM/ murein hydrolase activator NlpD
VAPSDPTTRHVGRIVDPAVRDDGQVGAEPIVELEPEAIPAEAAAVEPLSAEAEEPTRGELLRKRLLARAEAARRSGEPAAVTPEVTELEPATVAPPGPDAELVANVGSASDGKPAADVRPPPDEPSYGDLDDIGRVRSDEASVPLGRPSKPSFLPSTAGLSPTWIAVFGTLLGVAAVVSLLALVMSIDPKKASFVVATSAPQPSAAASVALPPETATPKRARTRLPGPWRIADAKNQPATRVVEGKIGTNAFLKALESAGIPLKEAFRVLASMKGVKNFDRCGANDRFFALLERSSSRLRAFEYQVGPEEVYQAREDAAGLLRGTKLDLKVERAQAVGAIAIKGKSFDEAAELAGFETGLARVVAKALDGHMALDELEHGDRVRVVAQELTVLGEFGRYTGVEALEVRRADAARTPLRIYYFDLGAERGYYDGEGHAPYEGGWRRPIKDAPMTSPFNLKRMHPVLKKVRPHLGMDLGSPTGTPVGAASFGTVSFIGNGGPSGNLVKVMHANEIETGYAHLSRFAEGLKVGDRVKRLQLVGYVGSTGRSTGPHLHFSASKKGEFFDPATLNLDGMRTLSKANRDAFSELKRRYDALLDGIPLPPPVAPAPPAAVAAAAVVASAEAGIGGDGDGDDPLESEPGPANPPAAAGLGAPAAPPNAVGATSPAAQRGSASAVHLSDKELLQLQGASDDGEVED